MPILDTDMTAETDEVLDATLGRLYAQHGEAGSDEREVLHLCIMAILEEQATRRRAWLSKFDSRAADE